MRRPIYGLSLTRPWQFAFHHGKRVENRDWRPSGRFVGSYVALHNAQSYSEADREFIHEATGLYVPTKAECEPGIIFAVCRWPGMIILEDPNAKLPGLKGTWMELLDEQQRWFFGPYGWLFDEYVELATPVHCSGARGLWPFNDKPNVLRDLRTSYADSIALTR